MDLLLWKTVLERNYVEKYLFFLRLRKTWIFTFWTRLHQLSKSFSSLQKNPLGESKRRLVRTVHDIYTLPISYLQFPIGHSYTNVPSLICYLSKIILPQKMPSYVENGHVATVGEKVRVGWIWRSELTYIHTHTHTHTYVHHHV